MEAPAEVTSSAHRGHLLFWSRYKKRKNSRTCHKTTLTQTGVAMTRVGTTQCVKASLPVHVSRLSVQFPAPGGHFTDFF